MFIDDPLLGQSHIFVSRLEIVSGCCGEQQNRIKAMPRFRNSIVRIYYLAFASRWCGNYYRFYEMYKSLHSTELRCSRTSIGSASQMVQPGNEAQNGIHRKELKHSCVGRAKTHHKIGKHARITIVKTNEPFHWMQPQQSWASTFPRSRALELFEIVAIMWMTEMWMWSQFKWNVGRNLAT